MDIELLRTFLEVVQTRHFGRSADNLYITQSAVSLRIQQLEQSLGVKLFIRQRNNIQLTCAGERLLPYAKQILMGIQRAKVEVKQVTDKHNQLSVAGSPNIWDAFLQYDIHNILAEHADVLFVADVAATQDSIRQLMAGTLDLIFVFDPPEMSELIVATVSDIDIIPVSTQACDDIATFFAHQYIYVNWGTAFSVWHARQFQRNSSSYFQAGTARVAFELMMKRGGSAFLPEPLVAPELSAGKLHKVACVAQSSKQIYAVYHKEHEHTELLFSIIHSFAPSS